jgi:predicted nucleic acid-binding Zn finger protein
MENENKRFSFTAQAIFEGEVIGKGAGDCALDALNAAVKAARFSSIFRPEIDLTQIMYQIEENVF